MGCPRFSSKTVGVLVILVALASVSAPAEEQQEPPAEQATLDDARRLIEEGSYADAETLARELLQLAEDAHGENSLETGVALDILVQALWRGGKAQAPETRAMAERAVRITEDLAGPDSSALSASLNELGNVLQQLGEFAEAISTFEQGLAIDEAQFGPTHLNVAKKLNNMGNAYRNLGDYEEARNRLERALAIYEAHYGPEHPEVADSIINLANTLLSMGQHEDALPMYERAISIREETLGLEHPDVAVVLNNLGYLLLEMHRYDDAESRFERALQIQQDSLGNEHPDLADTLMNLGMLCNATGDLSGSIVYYERSLAISEIARGADHWEVGSVLGNLALSLMNTGDLLQARLQLERALEIFEHSQVDPSWKGWILRLLGALQTRIGDWAEAKRYFERTVQIYEQHYGPEHAYVAAPLRNLAGAHQAAGEYAAALEILERALAICEQASGPGQRCAIGHLRSMASVMRDAGDLEGAKTHYERAMAIQDEVIEPGSLKTTGLLRDLAGLHLETGRLTESRALYDRVLEIQQEKLGLIDPMVGESLAEVAKLYVRQGELDSAFEAALRSEQIGQDYVRTNARGLSEREALRFSSTRPRGIDVLLSVAFLDPTPQRTEQTLDSVLRSRALVLDEMAERRRVMSTAGGDPETVQLVQQYRNDSERLAHLTVRGPGGDPELYLQLLEQARRKREKAERALGERSMIFRSGMSRSRVVLRDVRGSLPDGSVLVAYVRFDDHAPRPRSKAKAPEAPEAPVPTFAAFVLREDGDAPVLVRIGEAARIEALTTRWAQEAAHGARAPGWSPTEAEKAYRVAGTALREKIWDPIAPLLKGASIVFVVPEGSLHQVDVAALPVGDRSYVAERGPLVHYLSAERDLVAGANPLERGKGLLAIGAPDFEESSLIASLNPFRGENSSCADFESLRFEPLPGSRREVQEIAALWKKRAAEDAEVVLLTGAAASEAAFKAEAPGKRVVHIASHGFFVDGQSGENPLLLSGLALAGANQREAAAEDEEDGIVTAEEVAALDLGGVEWAVLSACGTGVGQVKAGEGIFGLRRAFRVAGVRTLIVSLWPVEDRTVQEWMSALYRNRFEGGLGTAEAVRAASLEMLRERRENDLSTHPSYWAGLVAAGDWR